MLQQKAAENCRALPSPLAEPGLWEMVFDSLPDLAAVVDQDHRFVRVNPALAARLGLAPAQMAGRHCYELIHGLDAPPAYCPHAQLLHDGMEHTAEAHEPRLGGHYLASSAPLADGRGRLLGSVHTWRDISARRAAELATQRHNLYLHSLHQTALDLMHHRDLADLLASMVRRAVSLVDSERGWVALLEGERMVVKVGAGSLEDPVQLALAPGEGLTGLVWQTGQAQRLADYQALPERLRQGTWAGAAAAMGVPILSLGRVVGVLGVARLEPNQPYQDEEMEILARYGQLASLALENHRLHDSALHDIAQRRQAEAALEWELMVNSALARLAHQLMAPNLALESVAQAVLEFAQGLTGSRRGAVCALDPVTREMLSHASDAELAGPPGAPGPGQAAAGLWGHALASGDPFFTNDPARHPASQADPLRAHSLGSFLAVPVAINSELVGQIALSNPVDAFEERDLRAVGRLAEFFALAVQRLRGKAERGRLEAQLRHSQKMEAVGMLAGGIAHDFNNILGSILGFTEMALTDARQGQAAESDLHNVLLACKRAKALVSRLLTFSRPGLERRQPLLLHSLVDETVKLLRATLPSTIALQTRVCQERGATLADPAQVHQVLMNLCTNASQALNPQGGSITVVLEDVEPDQAELARLHGLEPGRYARLMVMDDGQGMDPQTQEHIFEPFFTTKRGLSSGLGLSVVHGIVQAHGGGLQVTSAPGPGSVFSVLLPKASDDAPQAEPLSAPLPRGKERVLLVDDELPLLEVVSRMLANLGYQVEAFPSSQKALAALQARPGDFDLLLTDQTMPGLTGEGLARAALALRPDLPVIICTGFSETLTRERALEMGARLLLSKPLTRRELAFALREALEPKTGLKH
jgi:PAS domain S-box-containing protein